MGTPRWVGAPRCALREGRLFEKEKNGNAEALATLTDCQCDVERTHSLLVTIGKNSIRRPDQRECWKEVTMDRNNIKRVREKIEPSLTKGKCRIHTWPRSGLLPRAALVINLKNITLQKSIFSSRSPPEVSFYISQHRPQLHAARKMFIYVEMFPTMCTYFPTGYGHFS